MVHGIHNSTELTTFFLMKLPMMWAKATPQCPNRVDVRQRVPEGQVRSMEVRSDRKAWNFRCVRIKSCWNALFKDCWDKLCILKIPSHPIPSHPSAIVNLTPNATHRHPLIHHLQSSCPIWSQHLIWSDPIPSHPCQTWIRCLKKLSYLISTNLFWNG